MRRRPPRALDGSSLSETLLTFNPDDWPEAAPESDEERELAAQYPELGNSSAWRSAWREVRAHAMWRAARQEWVDAGGIWPGGEWERDFQESLQGPSGWPWDPSAI